MLASYIIEIFENFLGNYYFSSITDIEINEGVLISTVHTEPEKKHC